MWYFCASFAVATVGKTNLRICTALNKWCGGFGGEGLEVGRGARSPLAPLTIRKDRRRPRNRMVKTSKRNSLPGQDRKRNAFCWEKDNTLINTKERGGGIYKWVQQGRYAWEAIIPVSNTRPSIRAARPGVESAQDKLCRFGKCF